MKYKRKIILKNLFIFILPLFLWPGFAHAVADDDFSSSLNIRTLAQGEILVLKLDGGDRNLISGRAVGVVNAPIDTVWAVLSDYNNYQQFMPRLDVTYMVDLWFLLKMVRNPKLYRFSWTMVYGNMLINEGSWELKPYSIDGSKTLVSYTTRSDPGVNVPHFLENLALRSTLPDTIKSLRERVRQINKPN